MEARDVFLIFIILVGAGIAIAYEHYRAVFGNMLTVVTALMIPVFFIVIAIMFFSGPRIFDFPGTKTAITVLIVLLLIGGVFSTLGNDAAAAFSGNFITSNVVKTTQQYTLNSVFFASDMLSTSLILLIGLFLFFILLVRK